MKENFQDATEPCIGAVLETLDRICNACGEMSLSTILKSPSISLRHNHSGLDQMEWIKAQILNPPITLEVSQIKSNQAQCSVCNLIQKQLTNQLISAGSCIQVYKWEDLEGGVQSLWMYFPETKEPVLKITLFAAEGGIWKISVIPSRKLVFLIKFSELICFYRRYFCIKAYSVSASYGSGIR